MRANWGAIAVGSVSGLVTGGIVAIPLLATGVADTATLRGQSVLILVMLATQVVAGYVAARIAGPSRSAVNGGVAGLALYGVLAAVSLATGADQSAVAVTFGAIVALVLGTAGGVLATALRGQSS